MGIGPYITSSIIMQLMAVIVPALEKLQKVLAQNEERHSFLKQFADFLRTLNINLL